MTHDGATDADHEFMALKERLRRGDDSAEREVFERFANRLFAIARRRLNASLKSKVDADDVLQSVFRSFFVRQREGGVACVNWDGLWGMLVRITLRKCDRRWEHHSAARRDVRRECTPAADQRGEADAWIGLAREPTAEDACQLQDTLEHVMRKLDETGRQVLELRLQGFSVIEVAERIEATERTVFRKLDMIKTRLMQLVADSR
jgi:RNA polymerase sigma-70 factor (ECF subfamily)